MISKTSLTYLIYGALIIASIVVHATSNLGGILGCVVSAIGIIKARTIVFLVLSFANVSLSLAFDNFLRVDPYFYFYGGDPRSVNALSLVSVLLFILIGMLDASRNRRKKDVPLIDFKFPAVSPLLFWPCAIITVGATLFILSNESFVLQSTYGKEDLGRYAFLEYVALAIAFMLQSALHAGRGRRYLSYAIAAFFVLIATATSYRMVGIIAMLSAVMVIFNGKRVEKRALVVAWLISYAGLTYVSYWRLGILDVGFENILGYVGGRMDNTFTGVIETAMVYIQISQTQGLYENFRYLVGAMLPIPNSLIPDSMLYIVNMYDNYRVPGGGVLAGFMVYFNFIYLIPYAIYFWIAFRRSGRGGIADGMYLILFCTIMRWWLYGPYVIFKFLGVFIFFMAMNSVVRRLTIPSQRAGFA